jgi:hypothetical protein
MPSDPLEYASAPVPRPRRPIIDLALAFSCLSAALAVTVVMFVVVPRAQATFSSYSIKLPLATVLLLSFSRFCQGGGIALVWMIFAVPPFLAPLFRTWPPPADSRRRYFRPSRLLLTLFLMFFFGWIIMGLFTPYVVLLDTVSNPPK